jgi:hypothetical protein
MLQHESEDCITPMNPRFDREWWRWMTCMPSMTERADQSVLSNFKINRESSYYGKFCWDWQAYVWFKETWFCFTGAYFCGDWEARVNFFLGHLYMYMWHVKILRPTMFYLLHRSDGHIFIIFKVHQIKGWYFLIIVEFSSYLSSSTTLLENIWLTMWIRHIIRHNDMQVKH